MPPAAAPDVMTPPPQHPSCKMLHSLRGSRARLLVRVLAGCVCPVRMTDALRPAPHPTSASLGLSRDALICCLTHPALPWAPPTVCLCLLRLVPARHVEGGWWPWASMSGHSGGLSGRLKEALGSGLCQPERPPGQRPTGGLLCQVGEGQHLHPFEDWNLSE